MTTASGCWLPVYFVFFIPIPIAAPIANYNKHTHTRMAPPTAKPETGSHTHFPPQLEKYDWKLLAMKSAWMEVILESLPMGCHITRMYKYYVICIKRCSCSDVNESPNSPPIWGLPRYLLKLIINNCNHVISPNYGVLPDTQAGSTPCSYRLAFQPFQARSLWRNLGYEPLMRSINPHSSNCSCINYQFSLSLFCSGPGQSALPIVLYNNDS